jgi:hypothetical protein
MKKTPPKTATPPAAAPVKPTPAAALAKPATKAKKMYPDWLIEAPGGVYTYELMVSNDGGSVQIVPVTRNEYTQLKFYLARIRNIIGDEILSRYAPPAQQT